MLNKMQKIIVVGIACLLACSVVNANLVRDRKLNIADDYSATFSPESVKTKLDSCWNTNVGTRASKVGNTASGGKGVAGSKVAKNLHDCFSKANLRYANAEGDKINQMFDAVDSARSALQSATTSFNTALETLMGSLNEAVKEQKAVLDTFSGALSKSLTPGLTVKDEGKELSERANDAKQVMVRAQEIASKNLDAAASDGFKALSEDAMNKFDAKNAAEQVLSDAINTLENDWCGEGKILEDACCTAVDSRDGCNSADDSKVQGIRQDVYMHYESVFDAIADPPDYTSIQPGDTYDE